MDMVNKIINASIDFIKANKKIMYLLIGIIAFFIIFKLFVTVKNSRIEKLPIEKIEVTCDHAFKTTTKLTENMEYFDIVAIREGGSKASLESDKIKLSQDYVNPYGKNTPIEATYKIGKKEYSCIVNVPNERTKVVGFQCGYPNAADVVAVLYDNGELCFEGKGDTLVFYEGEYPWLTEWWEDLGIDEEDVTQIVSVTFQDTVQPTNLNYAFKGCESLVYVGKIPSTVRTMVGTFSNCISLKNAADVSSANILLNMNSTYEGCEKLVNANVIPENVRVAKSTFKDCKDLQVCADMTNARKIVIIDSMYENCEKLTSVTLTSGIKSMNSTFSECINLKQLANFPSDTIKYMNSTFSGAVSLSKFEALIPESVVDLTACFKNCEILAGDIYIDCNTNEFEEIFTGACQATKINLHGNSMLLDAFANTNDSNNAYVNNVKPNSAIINYSDIFED